MKQPSGKGSDKKSHQPSPPRVSRGERVERARVGLDKEISEEHPQIPPPFPKSPLPDESEVPEAVVIPRVADLFDHLSGLPLVKVAALSPVPQTGGAIAALLRDWPAIVVRAIGAAAVNQAIKAIACAAAYLVSTDRELLVCVPVFQDLDINGIHRTALSLYVTTLQADSIDGGDLGILLANVARRFQASGPKRSDTPMER